jgi:formyl-CoA transferase
MIRDIVAGDGEPLQVPGVIPVLSETPGEIRTSAPKLGEHTDAVLRGIGYSAEEISELRKMRIV